MVAEFTFQFMLVRPGGVKISMSHDPVSHHLLGLLVKAPKSNKSSAARYGRANGLCVCTCTHPITERDMMATLSLSSFSSSTGGFETDEGNWEQQEREGKDAHADDLNSAS